ncbi:MAG: glycoside hydrolase family 2 TIM barrel-domain containing protein [Chitinispirillaceae bacterium]
MRIRGLVLSSCAFLLVSGVIAAGWAQYIPLSARTVNVENKTWTFNHSDVAVATATGTSDPTGWTNVNLPHSFDIPYWRVGSAQSPAIGWYRKHITIDQAVINLKKRVFIEFEAAFQIANVYVNGTFVGMHKGGYTGFSFDITPYVKAGDNVMAVHLDAQWHDTIAPISGEHVFIGGIYRNVYLVYTDPLHVTWYGTFVSTPQATSTSGTVKVKTEIKNDGTASASCQVKTIVVDAAGTQVTSFSSTQTVAAGATVTFVQTSGTISNPHLWSPSSPYMYKVYTEVYNGTTAVDNFVSPLGFRTISWTTTNGFVLNGTRLWLQGANVHQDHAGWGDASASTGSYRDVKLIKDCGMNIIRGSHYPHAPAFADACDQLGVCLWSEAPYWACVNQSNNWLRGAYSNKQPFKQSCLDQCREMIRIHRNHPSIIIWSMGNELWFGDCLTGCPLDSVVALLGRMIAVAHVEDSTRPAGVGGVQLNTDQLSQPCDVVGFNGTPMQTSAYRIPELQSEYGSCTNGGTSYDGCWDCFANTAGAMTGNLPTQFVWRSGAIFWCGFDHGSNLNTGLMGMINNARLPQQRWYFYRNLYLGIAPPTWPVSGTAAKLKLTTDRDTITDDGRSDALLIVQVQDASGNWLSNTPNITLTDQSGLGSFPTGTSITFTGGQQEQGVLNGQASIEFRSYNAGAVTIQATSGSLTPASVPITVVHVPDNVVTAVRSQVVSHIAAGPEEMVVTGYGNRIVLPRSMTGKKVAVSLFDMRGRLIEMRPASRAGVIVRSGAADGIVIAKVKVVN